MLKVSDAFNSAFAAPDRELHARVTIGKIVYDSDDLTSINYDSGAMTGEQFSIGSTYMNSTKITFSHLVEGLKQLDEVLVEFGVLKPDGAVEYVKMGTFIVDDKIQMDRNNNTTTIECMDRMTMLGGAYVSKLTYPARIKDVAVEIVNMAGVKANETSFARLSENKINQPTGYTYRDAIGLIAQFQMGFALFDRDGLLDIRTLQDNSFKIDPNQYFLKGLVKNETFFKLNGISCTVVTTSKDENGNETSKTTVLQSGSSSGAQIKLANNVMTQDVLDRMYEALKFTNYYPFSLNWNGNPAVEAGDWLTVEDLQGNEFKVPNMSYTLTYNGGLTATSKADTSVSSPATYSYGGTISNIVNEIGGREGAEGNHIYEGTEDQKPLFPKEGDLWYKHVGPDTEEWIYKDGKWDFLTSTKPATDAQKAADAAQKEAEEAKKTANESVAAANDAAAKAGFANDTAEEAKSDAAAAGQQAKDALTSAGTAVADAATAKNDAATALTDAKKALTDSSSAMADSAQARKDSATAIKDAADSLTSAKDALNKVGSLTTSVTSQFTTVNNELKSKVNQTDYDKLKGTVTSQQTEINQNASGIKLKADKSYADTINNSVVKNTSSVGLLNDQIALTVSKNELNNTLSSYATQTWAQSQIKSTADSINLSVTKVQNNLDNMELGSVNLIIRKDELVDKMIGQNGTIDQYAGSSVTKNIISVEPGKYLTMTRYNSAADNNFRFAFYDASGAVVKRDYNSDLSHTEEVPPKSTTFRISYGTNLIVKLERGQKGTEYSAAPEDLASEVQFSQLQLTVNGIQGTVQNKADQSQVTQLANQISLKADTTALNELKGTVDKQGSEITLNTNSIKLKADQSSVNTLKGTVDKQGSAIDVNTKAIALKASQSTVDTLTGRFSTAEGKITVQADQIAQTVSKTELTTKLNDYATQTWTQGQIKTTADSINLNVSKVQTDLGGTKTQFAALEVKVDGITATVSDKADKSQVTQLANSITSVIRTASQQNMLVNSNFVKDTEGWILDGPYTAVARDSIYSSYQSTQGIRLSSLENKNPDSYHGFIQQNISANEGTRVSYSSMIRVHTFPEIRVYIELLAFDKNNTRIGSSAIEIPKTLSPGTWTYFKKDNVFLPTGTTHISLGLEIQGAGDISMAQPMLTQDTEVGPYTPDQVSQTQLTQIQQTIEGVQTTVKNKADQSQVTQLAGQITSVVGDVSANSSQITQMKADINLRVKAGDVVNQINISPEGILIDGKKVHITGQTSIDNAVIKDAMIANVTADKITAGTLNAANVNVINLNANNITAGTIRGANLAINLNTGEVVFQKGRIHSASNNVDVNIDQGYLSTASNDTRVMLKEGQLQLVQPTIFDKSEDPYLEISNSIGGASFNGANIIARDYLVLANRANSDAFFDAPLDEPETFAGLAVGKTSAGRWKPTRIGGADRGIIMRGGTAYMIDSSFMYKESPEIFVGTDAAGSKPSDRIYINGSYVHITSAYWRTASGSANLMVAQDGALVRSTSASKYKTDIVRTNIPDYGEKLLNLPTATWTDIAETKRYRDDPANQMKPTRNFGMIAEDLAEAGLEMLVVRGTDGELEGINYDRIGPALIPVIAKLKNEVETLKQQLEEKTA
ncbi:gp58-like family protein [Latilactobacillus curvatus]|uniref:gp58-like family protein n=1 Tax=Latilactobacillus curvatus TaxID=28038 RepID=UPI0020732528|nr:gp58-like family protein [Latilactobacillus curvatus]MCM6843953.1 gp58-like family protein [Latilactobacillus curvatus]MCM6861160.1 gp58-like family protein [Latilactobacillus curvatus]MCM6868458.1 gp58-like family protein [Latilactobacillus curvatus]